MHFMYFTEQPMKTYPREEGDKFGYTALLFSNENFDATEGSRLYNEFIIEYQRAEQAGFDGVMLNEHHQAPFCMQSVTNMMAAVLSHATERVKIVILGNPLPLADNPTRLSEELAMIDMYSKGRLVSGFVRGGGTEQLATNTNPAYNRERFNEAHDLIIKSWTEPGPFRWEGEHYHQRIVNPWSLPLQKPHPRVWIPGISSRETIEWAAVHGYPYIVLSAQIEACKQIWQIYDDTALQAGFIPGPEHRGYLIRCHVQKDEAHALKNAEQFNWMNGEFTGLLHPVWSAPSGYLGPWARRGSAEIRAGRRKMTTAGQNQTVKEQRDNLSLIVGTPDQVYEQLAHLITETRPSILGLMANDGDISHEDSLSCIELLGSEVLPRLRKLSAELGLASPFECNAPVSLAHQKALEQKQQAG